jgi:hypothetical protein
MKPKKHRMILVLEKDYLAKDAVQAYKMFREDKKYIHPNWKVKSEMFLKGDEEE